MTPLVSKALLRTQADDRLVALASEGSDLAMEAIVERYRRALLRHCRRLLPEDRAEDAVQQTFLKAWDALRRGVEVRELRPWLYRISHNTSLNALARAGYDYEELSESVQLADGPDADLERRVVMRRTLTGLADLPERQREALLRTAVEGRSADEVALELGVSEGAVRQLVHRARTSLRAAATAVVPFPLVSKLVTSGPGVERIGEVAAGAGSAGAGALLAKAGAATLVAGTLAAAPAVVERSGGHREGDGAGPAAGTAAPAATGDAVIPPALRTGQRDVDERDQGRSGPSESSGRRGSGGDDRSGPSDSSGPGGGGSGSSGGSSGSGSGGSSGSGSSGSGSSGSGSDTSGSSGSGSGSSGSGSSGSGSGSGGSGSGEFDSSDGLFDDSPLDDSGSEGSGGTSGSSG